MKFPTKLGLILWISLSGHVSVLFAQGSFPPNFCDPNQAETFCATIPLTIGAAFDLRYGEDPSCLSNTVNNFPTVEGTSNCVPEFGGYDVKFSDDDYDGQVNGERSAWNKDSDIAFFRGPGKEKITFFDENGDKIGQPFLFKWKDFYNSNIGGWEDKLTTIRWHPLENAIFYPKNHQLIKRSVSPSGNVGLPQVLVSFPGYRIGMSYGNEYRIAGGDANDVNAGRLLISLVKNGTNTTEFLVYDFNDHAIITQAVDLSMGDFNDDTRSISSFASHLFVLPRIDVAQVSASGLYIVANIEDGSTEQIEIYDFSGSRYDIEFSGSARNHLLNSNSHIDVVLAEVSDGVIRDGILVKIIGANQAGSGAGDMNVIYWYPESGMSELQMSHMTLLEWLSSAADLGGAQHSAVSAYHTDQENIYNTYTVPDNFPFRALTSMRQVDPDNSNDVSFPCTSPTGGTPWKAYFGEIVELSLTYRDLQPRRIVHHRIKSLIVNGSVNKLLQPEAWFSPDGEKLFFKSPDISTPTIIKDENLYFIDLPARTCEPLRISSGGSYRLANTSLLSPESIRIYPNPVSHGRSMWIAGITEEAAFDAELHLIGLDGRSHATWQGELQAGQAEKIPLTDFASGMYIAEVRDASNGVVRFRQKVVIR